MSKKKILKNGNSWKALLCSRVAYAMLKTQLEIQSPSVANGKKLESCGILPETFKTVQET